MAPFSLGSRFSGLWRVLVQGRFGLLCSQSCREDLKRPGESRYMCVVCLCLSGKDAWLFDAHSACLERCSD